jgi:hypothetical protein
MKILLFEYAVGSGEIVEKNIFEEGKLMFDKLLNDFLKDGNSVISIVDDKNYEYYLNLSKKPNLMVVTPDGDYILKLTEILSSQEIDCALIIAPECNHTLYKLTKLVEKYNVINLGSHSKGIKIAGNKYLTYLKIKNKVKTPKTFPPKKYVVKEIDGCGGSHQIVDENNIIQQYIDGEFYSVSLIVQKNGNDKNKYNIYPLSLNKQFIGDYYCGGEVNINHPLKKTIIAESIKAVEQIDGLNGYIGIDIIINRNDIYVLEINPRITTSIIGLNITPSLAKLIINNSLGNKLEYSVGKGNKFIRKNGKFHFGNEYDKVGN